MMISLLPASGLGLIPGMIPTLIDAALRSLLVAATVWVGLRLLRARNVVAQKAAWGLVLAGALLMPLAAPWAARQAWLPAKATLVLPPQPWFHAKASLRDSKTATAAMQQPFPASDQAVRPGLSLISGYVKAEPSGGAISSAHMSSSDRFPAPTISDSPSPGPATLAHAPPAIRSRALSVSSMAWLLYFAVCGALLLRILYGLGAAAWLWRSSEPVAVGSAAHLTHGLHVRSSRKLLSPVTVGSGIVLPADYADWDAEKLRIVLAHERSHVRQGDFYLQLCAGFYAAFFWFSPLGWWLKRKLSDLSEAISDRAGLLEAASRASYAQILLEFAARPRTTLTSRLQIGVAMARPGRLTHRIERLLNESSFQQAFGGGRRMLVALLLIPAALFAATALIRVQAAGQDVQQPVAAQSPVTGQSQPETAPDEAPPLPPPPPAIAPSPGRPAVPRPPAEPGAAAVPEVAPEPPEPPEPPIADQDFAPGGNGPSIHIAPGHGAGAGHGRAGGRHYSYSYSYDLNGDSYAIVTGDGKNLRFSGDWQDGRHAELDKARKMAHGDFIWFKRNGKSYIVDDPAKVAQIEALYKPMEELGRQQEELGRQQEAFGREQEKLGRQQQMASIPAPDLSKEMAELDAEVAKLRTGKGGTVTQEDLAELQGKIGDLQGKLGGLQGDIGAKMGAFGGLQGKWGEQQGKLGAEQGLLGEKQGRIAAEADRKVKSIIDESLSNGKARPVE